MGDFTGIEISSQWITSLIFHTTTYVAVCSWLAHLLQRYNIVFIF